MGSEAPNNHRRRVPRPLAFGALALAVVLVGVLGATLANALPGASAASVRIVETSARAPARQPPSQQPASLPTISASTACVCTGVNGSVPKPATGVPKLSGQVILVSTTQQWLWAYQDGHLVLASPVTTGRPQLPTPRGHFTVMSKVADTTFYSPWPPSSPFYYTPEHVNYAMLFKSGGFYLHDAAWRQKFGPGSQYVHNVGDGVETGSHGCVNLPEGTAGILYNWVRVGTAVIIV